MNVLSPHYLIVLGQAYYPGWLTPCSRNLLQEEMFANHMILLSEEIFVILNIASTVVDT